MPTKQVRTGLGAPGRARVAGRRQRGRDVGGLGDQRRDEQHDRGVDRSGRRGRAAAPARSSRASRRRACRPGCRPTPRPAAARAGRPASRRRAAGSVRPFASQASAQRMPSPPALVITPTRAAGRQRLVGQQRGHVEQLVERVAADDAGLAEERVDGHVGAGQRGRVRGGRALPGLAAAALDGHDRLARRDPPGDPREAAAVAERLEVEDDHAGRLVVLPALEQVVRREVGLVAHRDEARDADPELAGVLEDRDPERAGLGGDRDLGRPAAASARRSRWRSRPARSSARPCSSGRPGGRRAGGRAAAARPASPGPRRRPRRSRPRSRPGRARRRRGTRGRRRARARPARRRRPGRPARRSRRRSGRRARPRPRAPSG